MTSRWKLGVRRLSLGSRIKDMDKSGALRLGGAGQGRAIRFGRQGPELSKWPSQLTVLPPLPITRPAADAGTRIWVSSFTSSLGPKKFSSLSFP